MVRFLFQSLAILVFVLTIVSVLVISAIVCVGFFHVDSQNWKEPPGFFANGMLGVSTWSIHAYSCQIARVVKDFDPCIRYEILPHHRV